MKRLFVVMLTLCLLLAGCQVVDTPAVTPEVTDSPAEFQEGPLDLPTPELPAEPDATEPVSDPLLGPEGLPTPEL